MHALPSQVLVSFYMLHFHWKFAFSTVLVQDDTIKIIGIQWQQKIYDNDNQSVIENQIIETTESRYMKTRHPSKINIFEVLQTVLLAALVGFQLLAQNNLDNLPTQAQVDQIIASLSGISTQITTLSLSLSGLITPLTAIITGITGALGGVTTFITLIVNFLRGLLGAILPREATATNMVMENLLKTILDGFPESSDQVLEKVIHGFPLQDVEPSSDLDAEHQEIDVNVLEDHDAVQINKILMLSSKKDQVNFYQYQFKRKKIKA